MPIKQINHKEKITLQNEACISFPLYKLLFLYSFTSKAILTEICTIENNPTNI